MASNAINDQLLGFTRSLGIRTNGKRYYIPKASRENECAEACGSRLLRKQPHEGISYGDLASKYRDEVLTDVVREPVCFTMEMRGRLSRDRYRKHGEF